MTGPSHYVIKGGGFGRERLRVLSRVLASGTRTLVERAGLRPGMICLDLGCGAGDVTREMALRVGPSGFAVGIEIDEEKVAMGRAELAAVSNVELRLADVRTLDEVSTYDLVYARFLLTYLPDRAQVLTRVFRALRPGGVVVIEDIDFSAHFCAPPSAAFASYVRLFSEVVRRRGGDPDVGPKLPLLLRDAGFADVAVQVSQLAFLSGEGKTIAEITLMGIRDALISEGLATTEEVDGHLQELARLAADPSTVMSMPRVVQTWGTRP